MEKCLASILRKVTPTGQMRCYPHLQSKEVFMVKKKMKRKFIQSVKASNRFKMNCDLIN